MKLFALLLLIMAVFSIRVSSQQENQGWTDLVQRESSLLFERVHLHPSLSFADDYLNISTVDKGIVLGRLYFSTISGKRNADQLLFIIRYILSHELAHQIQFRRYGGGIVQASCELKRLYECQADIISGILLGRMYDLSEAMADTKDFHTVADGLGYLYANGDDEYGMALHPTPFQRRAAFRYGLGYHVLNQNRLLIEKWPASFEKKADSIDWSLDIARMIMHYPLANTQSIVCTSSSLDWGDRTVDRPYVKVREEYTNTAKEPLKMNIFYHVCGFRAYGNRLLRDTNAAAPMLSGETKYVTAILKPGEKCTFTETLNWRDVSTSLYMPFVILPDEEAALYNAEQLSPDRQRENGYDRCLESYADADEKFRSRVSDLEFGLDLDKAVRMLAANDWNTLESGFGLNLTGVLVNYRSSLKFPYSVKNSLVVNPSPKVDSYFDGFIDVDLYDDQDEGYARQQFGRIAHLIQDHFGDHVDWDTTENKEDSLTSIQGTYKGGRIYISLSLRIQSGYCSLNMNLYNLHPRHVRPSPQIAGHESVTDRWLRSIIISQQNGFKTIDDAPVGTFNLKDIIPPYVYSPHIGDGGASFLLCRGTSLPEMISKCDTLEKLILSALNRQEITYTVDHDDIKDSVYRYRIYYNAHMQKNQPDIELSLFLPESGKSADHYFISLHWYYKDDRKREYSP